MLDGLKLAFGTLTAIPVPAPACIDRPVAGRAMVLAPLTQLPLAGALLAWGWVVRQAAVPPLVAAALTLVALTLANRAMHLDGLADTTDGLSASYDRDKALEVMRRGNIGPSGVAAVTLVLLVDVGALASLLTTVRGITLVCLSLLASRHLLSWACAAGVPAARPEGLGATVAGTVHQAVAALGLLLLVGLSAVASHWATVSWWTGPVVVGSAVLGGAVVLHRTVQRFGGITGDVLGAVIEVSFASALAASALLLAAAR
jgi:adenosylcobinamide-GDP ribazoletransferase